MDGTNTTPPTVPLYFFSFPLFDNSTASQAAKQWTHRELRRMGFESVVTVATPLNFMATAAATRGLIERGLFATHTDTKTKARGCERLFGAVFEQLGYSPWLHGLAPMHCSHDNIYATKVSGPHYTQGF
jgi:hypothetical protein